MKKSLLVAAMLLLVFSKQILACDYYEDEEVLNEILDIGTYKSNVTGKVCSNDKRIVIPIKNGEAEGLAKDYYKSGALAYEMNFKNGKWEGFKRYYKSGKLEAEGNYKNGKRESLWKYYYKSGKLKKEENYKNGEKE